MDLFFFVFVSCFAICMIFKFSNRAEAIEFYEREKKRLDEMPLDELIAKITRERLEQDAIKAADLKAKQDAIKAFEKKLGY